MKNSSLRAVFFSISVKCLSDKPFASFMKIASESNSYPVSGIFPLTLPSWTLSAKNSSFTPKQLIVQEIRTTGRVLPGVSICTKQWKVIDLSTQTVVDVPCVNTVRICRLCKSYMQTYFATHSSTSSMRWPTLHLFASFHIATSSLFMLPVNVVLHGRPNQSLYTWPLSFFFNHGCKKCGARNEVKYVCLKNGKQDIFTSTSVVRLAWCRSVEWTGCHNSLTILVMFAREWLTGLILLHFSIAYWLSLLYMTTQ